MSTPQDSVAPPAPETTTPSFVGAATTVVRLLKGFRDWIAALSPSGASMYDTGWVDLTLVNGWTVASGLTPRVRRIGREVHMEGRVTGGSGGLVATLPPGMAPGQTLTRTVVNGGHSGSPSFTALSIASAGTLTANPGTVPNLVENWAV